jgi:LacI family transcriptional regulator
MRDVAAHAGVSQTTVSLVLSGKAGSSIPHGTQQRVRAAVEELGYRRNALAAGLRRQASDTIGFVSDFITTTPHAGEMVRGAQEAAWEAGKVLLMVSTQGDRHVERRAFDAVLERRVDGVILAGMFHQIITPPPELFEVPSILLDARCDDPRISSVVPDEVGAAYDATTHLIEAGHRRIGYVQSSDDVPAARGRLAGFQRALEDARIDFVPERVVRCDEYLKNAEGVTRLLRDPMRPTALFCFNDLTAVGVIRLARSVEIRIPEQLSIVGFDNQKLIAPIADPPLTTMELPHYQMGRWAVEHLLDLIDDPTTEPVHHRMPCPLVPRVSVAAPPGESTLGHTGGRS